MPERLGMGRTSSWGGSWLRSKLRRWRLAQCEPLIVRGRPELPPRRTDSTFRPWTFRREMYSTFFLAAVAFCFCFLLTPLVRRWSHKLDVLDHPKTARNIHATPVPRTGGIAIVAAYLGAIGLLL